MTRALLWLLLGVPGAAQAASTLEFEVRAETGAAAVAVVGGPVLIRLRGASAAAQAQVIVARLARLAEAGTAPAAFEIRRAGADTAVFAGGAVVCTATAEAARAARATPKGLAGDWQANLRKAFAGPYVSAVVPPLLPFGESTPIALRGQPAGTAVSATVTGAAAARVDERSASVSVTGNAVGPATLTLRRGPASLTLNFEIRMKAGRVAGPVRAAFTGSGTPAEMIRTAILSELYAVAELQPGVRIEPSLPRGAAGLTPGGQTVVPVSVRLSGGDTIPVTTDVDVSLSDRDWPEQPADRLLVSNDPEKVAGSQLLLRGVLPAGQRTRLLFHHKTIADRPLAYEVRLLNQTDAPSRVHLRDATCGPSEDEIFVGHQACLGYWRQRLAGQGYCLLIPPHTAWTVRAVVAPPNDIVSGLCELTPIEGGPVEMELVATSGPPVSGPRGIAGPSTADSAGICLFERPYKAEAGSYTAGGMHAFLNVGRDPIRSIAGTPLQGDYGVIYTLDFDFDNPGAAPARFELVFSADGGVARGVLVVDGKLRETGLVRPAQQERVLDLELPPGGRQRVNVRLMPQSGSNYPLRLVGRPYTAGWSGRSGR
ncbi:MAG: hypothetical protein HYU66_22885 [Armatimonadetes bacterium]|nr:hypothetical protein [Armatimonadota bacterium]